MYIFITSYFRCWSDGRHLVCIIIMFFAPYFNIFTVCNPVSKRFLIVFRFCHIACVVLQWTDHSNGWRFLCIEVHRDCSSWQQRWTVWRCKAIWSEGLYCCQSCCINYTFGNIRLKHLFTCCDQFDLQLKESTAPVYLHTRVITLTLAKQHKHYVYLKLYCSLYHSPGLSSRSMPSDALLHLSGTHYLHSSPTAALWLPSNLGWNVLFSVCLSAVAYTSDLITFPPASLKLRPYGAI